MRGGRPTGRNNVTRARFVSGLGDQDAVRLNLHSSRRGWPTPTERPWLFDSPWRISRIRRYGAADERVTTVSARRRRHNGRIVLRARRPPAAVFVLIPGCTHVRGMWLRGERAPENGRRQVPGRAGTKGRCRRTRARTHARPCRIAGKVVVIRRVCVCVCVRSGFKKNIIRTKIPISFSGRFFPPFLFSREIFFYCTT